MGLKNNENVGPSHGCNGETLTIINFDCETTKTTAFVPVRVS